MGWVSVRSWTRARAHKRGSRRDSTPSSSPSLNEVHFSDSTRDVWSVDTSTHSQALFDLHTHPLAHAPHRPRQAPLCPEEDAARAAAPITGLRRLVLRRVGYCCCCSSSRCQCECQRLPPSQQQQQRRRPGTATAAVFGGADAAGMCTRPSHNPPWFDRRTDSAPLPSFSSTRLFRTHTRPQPAPRLPAGGGRRLGGDLAPADDALGHGR